MTTKPLPWDEIRTPDTDYNVRAVANGGAIPAFWGRDTDGRCLLLLRLDGDHRALFAENTISVHGVKVDLQQDRTTDRQNLVLTLERQADGDLFCALCDSLVEGLRPVTRPDAALGVAMAHIRRWKAFMAGRNARLLSAEEVRGLFAELTFLSELYDGQLDHRQAVTAWTGADQIHQDFIFGSRAVEVKSLLGTDRSTVRISSEDQLETVQEHLFLLTYRMREVTDAQQGQSLNELVRSIETELQDAEAIEEFGRKLATLGYTPIQEYDKPRFIVSGRQAYRVQDGFPKIVRSTLPEGIVKVAYQIEIEKIEPFGCAFNELLEGI